MTNRPLNQYAPSGLRPAGKTADRSFSDSPNTLPLPPVDSRSTSASVGPRNRSGLPTAAGFGLTSGVFGSAASSSSGLGGTNSYRVEAAE